MKKILLVLAGFSLMSFPAWSQGSNSKEVLQESLEPIYEALDEGAEPDGGMDAFYKALGLTLRYPVQALRNGVEGKVYVEFVVTKEGKLEDIRVVKGVEKSLDKEAVRVIKLTEESPGWIPGRFNGEQVHARMIMPILFQNAGVISHTVEGL